MPSVPVEKGDERKGYTFTVLAGYPRLRAWMESTPKSHRSANICRMLENALTVQQTLQPTLLSLLERLENVNASTEAPSAFVQPGAKVELDADIVQSLMSLGD